MFDRAVVHVGFHKTGTTTIQHGLFDEAASLEAEEGIFYPRIAANHSKVLFSLFSAGAHRYAMNMRDGVASEEQAARQNRKTEAELDKAFAATSAKTLLLSGESLSTLDADGLERMKAWLEQRARSIEILVYVRDPLAWSASAAQHNIRAGSTFAAITRSPPLERIEAKITRLVAVFGHDAVKVISFEEAVKAGIFASFCQAAGISPAWSAGREPKTFNEAFANEAIHLISAINEQFPLKRSETSAPRRLFGDIRPLASVAGEKFRLPAAAARAVWERSQSDIAWLKESYGIDYTRDETPAFSEDEDLKSIPIAQARDFVLAVSSEGSLRDLDRRARNNLLRGNWKAARKLYETMLIVEADNETARDALADLDRTRRSPLARLRAWALHLLTRGMPV